MTNFFRVFMSSPAHQSVKKLYFLWLIESFKSEKKSEPKFSLTWFLATCTLIWIQLNS